MGSKNSTCLYLDKEVVATAKRMVLNVSKVSENALKEATERLKGPKPETPLDSSPPSKDRDRDLNPGAGLPRPCDSSISAFAGFLASQILDVYIRKRHQEFALNP